MHSSFKEKSRKKQWCYCWWLRNPANSPVDVVDIPKFMGFYTSQVVVSDFFHQQKSTFQISTPRHALSEVFDQPDHVEPNCCADVCLIIGTEYFPKESGWSKSWKNTSISSSPPPPSSSSSSSSSSSLSPAPVWTNDKVQERTSCFFYSFIDLSNMLFVQQPQDSPSIEKWWSNGN